MLFRSRTGTPAEAVNRFNRDINQFIVDRAFVDKMRGMGLAIGRGRTPREAAAFIHNEQERWKTIAAELELQPQ